MSNFRDRSCFWIKSRLETYFKAHPPAGISEAVKRLEELTGLKRSPTQVGIFLKKLGLKRLKTASVPAKFDADRQETLKKTSWSRGESKQKQEPEPSFLWMLPILCWEAIWAGCGALCVWWYVLPAGGNVSMCWEP